jgi:hypothetical protein
VPNSPPPAFASSTSRPWPRLARAVDEGDLPAGTDPVALARFLHVVQEGQAVHAAAGVSREQLEHSAAIALQAVPSAGRSGPASLAGSP